jgi:hypothetical protein
MIVALALLLVGFVEPAIKATKRVSLWTLVHGFGAFCFGMLMMYVYDTGMRYLANKEFVRFLAYVGDFHEASEYPQVRRGERVRLHENGVVSSAKRVNGRVVIETEKRDF